nr:MAG TPA: hypothetical protein [Caudoviricetes sp.]
MSCCHLCIITNDLTNRAAVWWHNLIIWRMLWHGWIVQQPENGLNPKPKRAIK